MVEVSDDADAMGVMNEIDRYARDRANVVFLEVLLDML